MTDTQNAIYQIKARINESEELLRWAKEAMLAPQGLDQREIIKLHALINNMQAFVVESQDVLAAFEKLL